MPVTVPAVPEAYADLLVSWSKGKWRRAGDPLHLLDQTPQRTQAAAYCRVLHARIARLGFRLAGRLASALVDLYCKSGDLVHARRVFHGLSERDGTAWSALLSAHTRHGSPGEVISEFEAMRLAGASADQHGLAIVLSSCARVAELSYGRRIHCDIIKTGFGGSAFCQGSLVNMYAKCCRLEDARRLFDRFEDPDTITWTAMIGGYVQAGRPEEALEVFDRMRERGDVPDEVTSVTAITAYVCLGRLQEARNLFMAMASPNCIAWNAMISGHAQNGHEAEALEFFREMHGAGVRPTRSTLGSVLSAAANLMALDAGRQAHCGALRLGLDSNVFVGSSLINLYAKCRAIEDARKVFDPMLEKNLVLWNAMLGGYTLNGRPQASVELFLRMKGWGLPCDEFTYVSLFGASASLESPRLGRQLHCAVIKRSYDRNAFVGNSVVDMYSKCGELGGARRQFELIPDRDVVSWNALMVGQVHNGCEAEALCTFCGMRGDAVEPDAVSFATVISACSSTGAFAMGKQAHCLAVRLGLESNTCVGSSLVDMYGKFGEMESARRAFELIHERSEVSTNALIAGYVQNDDADEAVRSFRGMLRQGLKPSPFTFASVLPACADSSSSSAPSLGRQLHCQAMKSGSLRGDVYVEVALLTTYLKSRCPEDAIRLFSEVPGEDQGGLILWTAIISGHAQNGYCEDAITLFWKMHNHGVLPDQSAFASALGACADLASLRDGRAVHSLLVRSGFVSDEYTGSALVDVYSKCGDISSAVRAFEEVKKNKGDPISWNSMIAGLAKNGLAEEALTIFRQMCDFGVDPDEVTFLGVLTACSHAGLVAEGRRIFDSMERKYGVTPRADHYACLVDLLGRGGHLEEAEALVRKGLPFEPDGVIWATLLSACRVHGDGARGGRAAAELMKVEPRVSSPYVLLTGLCAGWGNWEGVRALRGAMKERGVRKAAGRSWITVGEETSAFVAGDKFHPDAAGIYSVLDDLSAAIQEDEGRAGEED